MADDLPRFFKVFVAQSSSDSLLIPVSYYDELPSPLPETVTLQGIRGVWNVSLKKEQNEVYLAQGWSSFVTDNSLTSGDFLTFIYNGNNIFEVSKFNRDGCKEMGEVDISEDSDCSEDTKTSEETETVPRSMDKGKKRIEVVSSSDEESDSDSDGLHLEESSFSDSSYYPESEGKLAVYARPKATNLRKKGKSISRIDNDEGAISGTSNSARKPRTMKFKAIIKNPEAYLKDPKNIYFETALKNRPYELLIPEEYVKDYHLMFLDHVEYIDDIGSYKVKTAGWKDERVCIKNFQVICKRLQVKKEDRILCELFRKDTLVHAVGIYVIREKDLK